MSNHCKIMPVGGSPRWPFPLVFQYPRHGPSPPTFPARGARTPEPLRALASRGFSASPDTASRNLEPDRLPGANQHRLEDVIVEPRLGGVSRLRRTGDPQRDPTISQHFDCADVVGAGAGAAKPILDVLIRFDAESFSNSSTLSRFPTVSPPAPGTTRLNTVCGEVTFDTATVDQQNLERGTDASLPPNGSSTTY